MPGLGSGRAAWPDRDDTARRVAAARKRIDSRPMKVEVETERAAPRSRPTWSSSASARARSCPAELAGAAGAADAKGGFKKLTAAAPRARRPRVLVVGLGKREELDAERLRVAAALAAKEAARLEATLARLGAARVGDDAAARRGRSSPARSSAPTASTASRAADPDDPTPPRLESLTLLGAGRASPTAAEAARVCAEAQNRARDLQSLPANVATPSYLADARRGDRRRPTTRSASRCSAASEIAAKEMGGLVAVSQGGAEEPQLIVLRYAGGGSGPTLGLVGKGVTFDTGGISLKPGGRDAGDEDGHVRRRRGAGGGRRDRRARACRSNLIAVVPSTENMPSGTAIKPGDIITQYNGKTVEVNNTDAEGRLILADALAYAVELGAERIVDIATLTGAVDDRARLDLRRR